MTFLLKYRIYLSFAAALLSANTVRGEGITFQPINFDLRSSKLTEGSKDALKRVAQLLKLNPNTRLRLEGHATEQGDGVESIPLSEGRANVARDFLVGLGIPESRLDAVPKSAAHLLRWDKPLSMENQRVEFVFLDKASGEKKNLEKINIVYWNTLYHSLYQIAAAGGFFEQEGFDVNLIATNHGLVDQVKSVCGVEPFLKGGALVFSGAVCGGSPHQAIADGVPIVVIGGMLAGGAVILAKPELAAKLRADPTKFKGLTFGRPKGTYGSSMMLAYFLFQKGVDSKKDIKFRDFNSHEDVVEALGKGTVDVGDSYFPLSIKAHEKYGLDEVYHTSELFPYHPCCRIVTTIPKLKAHREKYVRFMRAMIKAHEFLIRKPKNAIDIITQYTGYDRDDVQKTLTNPNFKIDPDPLRNGFLKFWKRMIDTGYLKSKEDVNKHIDISIYENALKSLIKESPQNDYYAYTMQHFREYNY